MKGLRALMPFVEAVEEYSQFRDHAHSPSQVVNQGLNTYTQLPHVQFAALFMTNEDTFDFEFKEAIPGNYKCQAQKLFSFLVEDSTVGAAVSKKVINLSSGTLNPETKNAVVIPLIKPNGIIGLVVLKLDMQPDTVHEFTLPLANIHSSLFSYSLENCFLYNKNAINKQIMDQMVAERTLDLVNSKRILAEKIGNLQSSLTSALPHEVRTPINQIMGNSDFILKHLKTLAPEEISEMVSDIRSSAHRLKRMTENYLYFSHLSLISTNFADLHNLQKLKTISAGNMIKDIVNDYAFAMGRENDMELEIEESDVCMSSEFFDKMIVELLDNSLKYSQPGSKIYIKTKIAGCMYDITICDTGRGITEEQINMIDAYVQFERKSFEQQGSGLGLAIVSKIVYLHKGTIAINRNYPVGTKIDISLPICQEQP